MSLAWPGPGILGSRHGAGSVQLHGAGLVPLALLLLGERGASPAQGGHPPAAAAGALGWPVQWPGGAWLCSPPSCPLARSKEPQCLRRPSFFPGCSLGSGELTCASGFLAFFLKAPSPAWPGHPPPATQGDFLRL